MFIFPKLRPPRELSHTLFTRIGFTTSGIKDANCNKFLIASYQSNPMGVDAIKMTDDDQEDQNKCLFPLLKQLNATTEKRLHTFSVSSDHVVNYIRLGVVNKNLAIQYCHYLAHLCRQSNSDDIEHYASRVINLTRLILARHKDLPFKVGVNLLTDLAGMSEAACKEVCDKLIDEFDMWNMIDRSPTSLLVKACYKFKLWDLANRVLDKCCAKTLRWNVFDALIINMSETLKTDVEQEIKETYKRNILCHLQKLFEFTRKHRVQFVTTHKETLIQCLEGIFPKVQMRPNIKMSGRCTQCDSSIPLYDNENVSKINGSLRQVLDKQHHGNLHLCSNKSDLQNFYQYLEHLHKIDKKPIDCVIDGLNLAYKNSGGFTYIKQTVTEGIERTIKHHDRRFQVQVLVNAIIRSDFLNKYKKILVIGKEHMKTWPGLLDFFEKNNIHFYTSDDHAEDDLFMLYAATFSPRTIFVTNDFLRDHLVLFDDDARVMLERYIDTHQVWIHKKTLRAINPTPFEKLPYLDETSKHLHIPVIDRNKIDILSQQEPPPHLNEKLTTWLCCSFKRSRSVVDISPGSESDQYKEAN